MSDAPYKVVLDTENVNAGLIANSNQVSALAERFPEKLCKSCKFWTKPEDRTDFTNAVRYINDSWDENPDSEVEWIKGDVDDKKFGICSGIQEGFGMGVEDPLPLAVVRDGSDYKATPYTQAEFGCVLWEKRDVL